MKNVCFSHTNVNKVSLAIGSEITGDVKRHTFESYKDSLKRCFVNFMSFTPSSAYLLIQLAIQTAQSRTNRRQCMIKHS